MKVPSVMPGGHQFSQVPKATIPRSQFDRSHGYKTTFDAGYLIPVYVDEALPGDTFALSMTGFARLATPLKPIMDNMMLDTFFFAVPIRLIWTNWERFNGAQPNPGDSTDFTVPQIVSTAAWVVNSIYDYMGLPLGVVGYSHSVLPLRAYSLIWNEWFRDENLQNRSPSTGTPTNDGPDAPSAYTLLRRGKRHDYFTSCLPWPQKGDSVSLPLGTSAPVIPDATPDYPSFTVEVGGVDQAGYPGEAVGSSTMQWRNAAGGGIVSTASRRSAWLDPGLKADLTAATSATINELRQAFQVQKLLERDARGGTRYTEIVRSHFGVTSPDARLQRPEYLGGGSSPVLVSPVAQTSSTDVTTPQANLAAIGTASWSGHGFTKSFTEHCILIGLASVRADLTYQQGLDRMWSRNTRYDFYWPALSHIGEQAVLSKEIYLDGTGGDEDVFGYQERYAEYRYKPSKITGLFRSTVAGTLDVWHLSQEFSSRPTLSSTFIQEDPPVDRIIAVPTEPHFLFDSYFRVKCARPMPVYGVPGLIDHF